jgi:hypothetical protein
MLRTLASLLNIYRTPLWVQGSAIPIYLFFWFLEKRLQLNCKDGIFATLRLPRSQIEYDYLRLLSTQSKADHSLCVNAAIGGYGVMVFVVLLLSTSLAVYYPRTSFYVSAVQRWIYVFATVIYFSFLYFYFILGGFAWPKRPLEVLLVETDAKYVVGCLFFWAAAVLLNSIVEILVDYFMSSQR